MEDPVLTRNLADTKELATRWAQFHDFFMMATKTDKISADAERKFMELKTRIAMLHDALMQSIKQDQKVGQNVINVMRQCLMLRTIPQMSQTEIQKIEFDWNEVYLLMTETVANLEEDVARLAGISKRAYQLQILQKRIRSERQKFFANTRVRVALWVLGVTSVLSFVLFGIPALGIYDYKDIKADASFLSIPYNSAAGIARLFAPEIAYVDLGELKAPFVQWGSENVIDKPMKNRMGIPYFVSQMPNYGFSTKDVDEISGFISTRRVFQKELLRDPSNKKLFVYIFLFKETEEAVRFMELRQANLDAMTNIGRQKKIEDRIIVGRKANFVVLVDCKNRLTSSDFLITRWMFKPEQIDNYAAPLDF